MRTSLTPVSPPPSTPPGASGPDVPAPPVARIVRHLCGVVGGDAGWVTELLGDRAVHAGPADGDALGGRTLVEAIRQELTGVETTGPVGTDLVVVGAGSPPDAAVADEVFRVVQEALANAAAHAGAGCVRVGVMHGPGTLTVLVEDDGRGFDAAAHTGLREAAAGARLGLRAMAARARRLDGELEVESEAGRGTRLRLTVPSAPPAPVAAAPARTRPGVLVAAARPVVRAGVVRMLQLGEPGLGMVSEVGESDDLVGACRLLGTDVLVVEPDLLGGGLDGDLVAALDGIAAAPPAPAVVLLAPEFPDDELRAAVAAGVKGCVGPDAGGRLVAVVAAAGRGETLLADDQLGRLAAPPRPGGVTARERQVRALVARGLTDRQIGTALQISTKTVEKHVGSLLRKTGARNRTMLTGCAPHP